VRELEQGRPELVTVENARRKALAVREPEAPEAVLGCDTVVVLDGVLYGKPADLPAARRTLMALSGRTHEVFSGLVLLLDGEERTAVARTEVTFRPLEGGLLDWYLAGGEWRGRAGGYAIQGTGAALVRSIAGDYENVVGLPLASLLDIYPELLGGR
jgi:septum formation protein